MKQVKQREKIEQEKTGRNSRAPAVPFFLFGIEDVLQVACEEIHEDVVGIHGRITPELPLESLGHGLAPCPLGHYRPAEAREARENTRERRNDKIESLHCDKRPEVMPLDRPDPLFDERSQRLTYTTRYQSLSSMRRPPSHGAQTRFHPSPTTWLFECPVTPSSSVQRGILYLIPTAEKVVGVFDHPRGPNRGLQSWSMTTRWVHFGFLTWNPEQPHHFRDGRDFVRKPSFTHGSSSFRTGSSSSSSDEPDSPLENAHK